MSMEAAGAMDGMNSSDGDSRGSSMAPAAANGADSSENESEDYGSEGQAFLWGDAAGAGGGRKRGAAEEPLARHARSLSMDSLMGKLSFSANGEPSKFSLEFGSGEFTPRSSPIYRLQRDSSGLATHNNELKFRLQAMEQ